MTVFYLNSDIISGHEYMFRKIYEKFKYPKCLVSNISFLNFHIFFNKKIIVSSGSPRQNLFFIFFISFIAKKVFVYTPFGFDLRYFGVSKAAFKNLVYEFLLNKKNISFITCSYEQKAYFKTRFPQKIIFVLRNFNLNNSLYIKDHTANSKPQIFYVGRIDDSQKNVSFFIDLKKIIKNEIFLIGKCTSKSLLSDLQSNGINILDASENPYMHISRNDIVVLPSKFEGAALVVIESSFLTLPIFLMDSVGNRHITQHPILFNNQNDLSDLILLLESKDKLIYERIALFQQEVINEYCEQNFNSDIEYFQEKLINNNEKECKSV